MGKSLSDIKKLTGFLPINQSQILGTMSVAMEWDDAVEFYREIAKLAGREIAVKQKTSRGIPIRWFRSVYGHLMTVEGHPDSLKSVELSIPVNGRESATVMDLLAMSKRFLGIFPDSETTNSWLEDCMSTNFKTLETYESEGLIYNFNPQPELGVIHISVAAKNPRRRRAPAAQISAKA